MKMKICDAGICLGKNKSSFTTFLSQKEQNQLFKKLPQLEEIQSEKLEERLVVLSSLQFEDLKTTLFNYPELLLLDSCISSEKISKLLEQYRDIPLVQQAFIEEYCQNKE